MKMFTLSRRFIALSLLACALFPFLPAEGMSQAPIAPPAYDPRSKYKEERIESWTVLVHDVLDAPEHRDLRAQTLKLLGDHLYRITRVVPEPALERIRRIPIWIERAHPKHPCMCYHPDKGWLSSNGMNPEKAGAVEIANCENFLKWTIEQPWMVLHELAHGYHHQFVEGGYENPRLRAALEKARSARIYDSVLHWDGKRVRAYALNNQQEYFAEASEAYFGSNDFYPFVRAELKEHDPELFEVVRELWSAREASRAEAKPSGRVKVFILAGQSNMEGKAKVALLEHQVKQPATRDLFKHYERDGKWVERDDVWIKFLDRKGKLTVGFGSPGCIGPELELGHVLGNRYEEPVLLIKTAWGGRSLFRDFRSPSAGLPPQAALEKLLEEARKRKPETTLEEVKAPFGASYRDMLEEVNDTLARLKEHFPQYEGQGHEIAGFIWFQGWNDMISAEHTAEYTANLAHFIRDVRNDLKSPGLPFVVGEMGVDGLNAGANVQRFKAAQAAILDVQNLKGTVALVKTDLHWDLEAEAVFKKGWRENLEEWNKVGSDWPYHYLGSARTLCAIGKALAEAAIRLRGEAPL